MRAFDPSQMMPADLRLFTTEEREGLRVGRLSAERTEAYGTYTVTVRATARFKPCPDLDSEPQGARETWPGAVSADADPDPWGYVETEPIAACVLHDCTEIETDFVVHGLVALNDADACDSGYRDAATKTNSLLDRIYDAASRIRPTRPCRTPWRRPWTKYDSLVPQVSSANLRNW